MPNAPMTHYQQSRTISHWLASRQAMIVSFNQLCLLKPFSSTNSNIREIKIALDTFCEHLIDYFCQGQFNVFEKIAHFIRCHADGEHQKDGLRLSALLKITQQAIQFNDYYSYPEDFSQLESELSSLGEAIATRLEIEDALLEKYTALMVFD